MKSATSTGRLGGSFGETIPPVQGGIEPSALPARSAPMGVSVVVRRVGSGMADCAEAGRSAAAVARLVPARRPKSRRFIVFCSSFKFLLRLLGKYRLRTYVADLTRH